MDPKTQQINITFKGGNKSDIGDSGTDIDAKNIIRVILQFLKENGMQQTFHVLQEEAKIYYSAALSKEQIIMDIQNGNIARLLEVCGETAVPPETLFAIFEHVCLELLESGDTEAFDRFWLETPYLTVAQTVNPAGVSRLQTFRNSNRRNPKELWRDNSKLKRRKVVARLLCEHVEVVKPQRLITMIGESIRWKHSRGVAVEGKFNVLQDSITTPATDESYPPVQRRCSIQAKEGIITCAAFSPDCRTIAIGTSSGIIDLYYWTTGKLRVDLEWVAKGFVLEHQEANGQGIKITSLAFSHDGQVLASGDAQGNVIFWQVVVGRKGQAIKGLHTGAVNSIVFHPSDPQILTGSVDGHAKLTHIKSGSVISVFEDHDGFVIRALFDGHRGKNIITACSDGMLRVYSTRNNELGTKFAPSTNKSTISRPPIVTLLHCPPSEHSYIAASATDSLCIVNNKGSILATIKPELPNLILSDLTVNVKGRWVIGMADSGTLFAVDTQSSQTVYQQNIGLKHAKIISHQMANVVGVWGENSELLILEA